MQGLTLDELKVAISTQSFCLYLRLTLQDAVGADVAKFGQGKAFRNKWIAKGAGKNSFVKQVVL